MYDYYIVNPRGHNWITIRETEEYSIDNTNDIDPYWNEVDTFAYESGFHNGPVCKNCGLYFCEHCKDKKWWDKQPNCKGE